MQRKSRYEELTLNEIKSIETYKDLQYMNNLFWSPKQAQLREDNQALIKDGYTLGNPRKYSDYCIAMNDLRTVSFTNSVINERVKEKEKALNCKLTLREKHLIRDEYKIESMMSMSRLTRKQCESIINNDNEFATKGNTVVFLIDPESVALRKKKPDAERIEVKNNTNFNNPNIRYGYFQKFKMDKTGKVFILIKDIQRQYIGEKLDASPTAYSYSMIGTSRIQRMFVLKGNEWVEFKPNCNQIVENVWKELE